MHDGEVSIPGRAIAVLVLAGAVSGCASTGGPRWLAYTVEDAAAQRKPLVVEFYADWCAPCRVFERNVLTEPRVRQMLESVVFVRYDVESAVGRDAYARCRGRGVPLFVGIDTQGVVRLMKRGTGTTADQFLVFLTETQQVLGAQFANR